MAVSPLGWHVFGLPGAHDMVARGCSIDQIADALGVSELTVKRWGWRNRIELPRSRRRANERHTTVAELAKSGKTIAEIAADTNYSYVHVCNILRGMGIKAARQRHISGPANMARAEKMASMYRQGLTLEKIGQHFRLTRERVRQIIRALGVLPNDKIKTAKGDPAVRKARMDAASMLRWGVPYDEKKRYRADGTILAYTNQRNAAKSRSIEWGLPFVDWLAIWEASGKMALRGRGKGRYVMSRIKDDGGYVLGNVHIQLSTENNSEGIKKCRHNKAKTPGVWKLYPGLAKPWLAKGLRGKVLGLFATEEEAAAVRMAHLEENGLVTDASGRAYLPADKRKRRSFFAHTAEPQLVAA
jgi:transposase